jgi:two-component system alkaline phosphatase synthesis response regulator PhoP
MKKILIIEDEEIIYTLLEKKLSNIGYEVAVAKDGEEGLRTMQGQRPDLVLMDILMPKKNGFEVLEAMQKDNGLKTIPVIVISNSGQPVELEKVKALGARDWLIKTEFDPKEVLDKVKKQIGQ